MGEHVEAPVRPCRYRSAVHGFGRDVPSHEPVGSAGESAVSEESDGIAETGAHQSGGNGEHFTHAWPAFGPLVANDDYISRLYDASFDGGESCFFFFKTAHGAAENLPILTRHLYHAALPGQIFFVD